MWLFCMICVSNPTKLTKFCPWVKLSSLAIRTSCQGKQIFAVYLNLKYQINATLLGHHEDVVDKHSSDKDSFMNQIQVL